MKKIISATLIGSMVISLVACGSNNTETAASAVETTVAASSQPVPDTFEGTGTGRNGDIKVEITMDGDRIASVVVTEHQETAGIADPALERIPAEIVEYQSLGIDAVSGATITSDGILEAVEDALGKAGADVEAFKNAAVENGSSSRRHHDPDRCCRRRRFRRYGSGGCSP